VDKWIAVVLAAFCLSLFGMIGLGMYFDSQERIACIQSGGTPQGHHGCERREKAK
jgi:hypothetical protein